MDFLLFCKSFQSSHMEFQGGSDIWVVQTMVTSIYDIIAHEKILGRKVMRLTLWEDKLLNWNMANGSLRFAIADLISFAYRKNHKILYIWGWFICCDLMDFIRSLTSCITENVTDVWQRRRIYLSSLSEFAFPCRWPAMRCIMIFKANVNCRGNWFSPPALAVLHWEAELAPAADYATYFFLLANYLLWSHCLPAINASEQTIAGQLCKMHPPQGVLTWQNQPSVAHLLLSNLFRM